MPATEQTSEKNWPQPISPAKRRRLQQCFEYGRANVASGNFDYAIEMFSNSVEGDPGNLLYVQSFMGALQKKYGAKKGASSLAGIKSAAARRAMKKAADGKDWESVVKQAVELLRLNPGDAPALLAMASVCEQLRSDECQLYFLKAALDTNPKDPDINRICAQALARVGQFDQSIVCWHRVEKALPNDEEPPREIAKLTVIRQMPRDKQQEMIAGARPAAGKPTLAPAAKSGRDDEPTVDATPELTAEQRLQAAIEKHPDQAGNYIELSEIYLYDDRFDEAEELVRKALSITGPGDLKLRERLEDYQIRRRRRQWEIAEQRARADKTEEAATLAKRMKAELNRIELEVFASRCERNPGNELLHYELGLRLKRAGKFSEAIQNLQIARGNVKRKASVHVELGECFQYIKQYKLAMSNYEQAAASCTDKDEDIRKLAHYRAGVLAMGLKELDLAERHLTDLAGLDFGYKDVAERLDKITHFRNSK